MKRVLVLVALAAMAMGCAVDQEDPIVQNPGFDPDEYSKGPVTSTLSGDLDKKAIEPKARDRIQPQRYNDIGNWQVVEVPAKGK